MKTIIVDDERIMLEACAKTCEKISGIEIVGKFDDALDAYEFVKKNPIDLAFLDILLPITSGIELARMIKELYRDVCIIFVSASEDFRSESLKIGADSYLSKPYTQKDVEEALKKAIRLKSA